MSPNFGPLSAKRADLLCLTKHEAMGRVRNQIRQAIRRVAPPVPVFHLPHEPDHIETGPRLFAGTEGQLDAGRWFQVCKLCDPVIRHFITDRLDARLLTGNSHLGGLFQLYHEIKAHPEEDNDRPIKGGRSLATTCVRRS
ncbi:hypothetical protein GALMADRAFT_222662 [Galerina marginata CBS 339.88]|uniref:Uncharacterized protein n=1 Tax=Galerina marginata (strain CBS 339.88) TaxID=685588 RepID=A0A067TMG9_GALM3|nr:hypothetical protein GALMADRAFT_222662 [Galerina marginata CBS 339.88]